MLCSFVTIFTVHAPVINVSRDLKDDADGATCGAWHLSTEMAQSLVESYWGEFAQAVGVVDEIVCLLFVFILCMSWHQRKLARVNFRRGHHYRFHVLAERLQMIFSSAAA